MEKLCEQLEQIMAKLEVIEENQKSCECQIENTSNEEGQTDGEIDDEDIESEDDGCEDDGCEEDNYKDDNYEDEEDLCYGEYDDNCLDEDFGNKEDDQKS